MARKSIDIQSFAHENPIPAASRVGPLVVSSIIAAFDPGTRNLPEGFDAQIRNVFTHIGQMLDGAGATWEHVAKITFYVSDISFRAAINPIWVEHFPDANARPARYTQHQPGGGKALVSAEFIAYVE